MQHNTKREYKLVFDDIPPTSTL